MLFNWVKWEKISRECMTPDPARNLCLRWLPSMAMESNVIKVYIPLQEILEHSLDFSYMSYHDIIFPSVEK